MNFLHRPSLLVLVFCFALLHTAVAQQPTTADPPPPPAATPATSDPPANATTAPQAPGQPATPAMLPPGKRVLGVLPNYRTANLTADYQPITPKQKITIALKDSFDYPLIFVGAAYAGLYQLEDSHPQFGQGVKGYLRRFGTAYCDQVVGNMMTEGVLPIAFHEDPRYFRIQYGTKWHRTWYALSRIVVTRTDSGAASFNFAEIIGNGVSAGVGLAYYSDDRNVPSFMQNWGTQIGTDAVSQVLKEFWPDIKHRYFSHNKAAATANNN
jgi:hypothetical protein